jgi:hypothetical protein
MAETAAEKEETVMSTGEDDRVIREIISRSIEEAWRELDNVYFGTGVQSPVPMDDPSRQPLGYVSANGLTIDVMEKMLASLPAAPPAIR